MTKTAAAAKVDELDEVDMAADDVDDGVTLETRNQIVDQQLSLWRNTRYSLKRQFEVHQILDEKEQMDNCRKDMVRCQKAIVHLDGVKRELALEAEAKRNA